MDVCPHCHRRLLSHISARCNWCGAEIKDPAYLAQAEVERAASRAEDALHTLQSLTISAVTERYSRFRRGSALFGLPPLHQQDGAATLAARMEYEAWERTRQAAVFHAQQNEPQPGRSDETPAEKMLAQEPAAEAHDWFGHLEL